MGAEDALAKVWDEAATDLDIDVENHGRRILVLGFGSEAGMLCECCETRDEEESLRKAAEEIGAGWSVLGDWYLTYDRESFVDALTDWGWFGKGDPPAWIKIPPAP